jgi:V-type H+-transporting ATPase subunit a
MLFGFFSIYVGCIYNEFAGYSLNLISSCYTMKSEAPYVHRKEKCTIPFGMDPVWTISENGINYVNSLKMKIAVILGSVHMLTGVVFKAINYVHKKDYLHFFGVFLPQLLYMGSFLSYLVFLIFYKWNYNWTSSNNSDAPSIITMLANILLKYGGVGDDYLFEGQYYFSYTVIITLVVSIIWMQIVVPLAHKKEDERKHSDDENEFRLSILNNQQAHSSDSAFIYQFIETSEFSLGVISNTASYLRLWALSLAHSELSSVALEYFVRSNLTSGAPFFLVLGMGWVILASFTFGILLVMDSMECMLHTLRLHWVEFQNKFYKGEGRVFTPYNFTKINKE